MTNPALFLSLYDSRNSFALDPSSRKDRSLPRSFVNPSDKIQANNKEKCEKQGYVRRKGIPKISARFGGEKPYGEGDAVGKEVNEDGNPEIAGEINQISQEET